MGGGLLQLVAYGAQDAYLTCNPQITFFKSVYRRYTNFGMETIELSTQEATYYGTADLSKEYCINLSTAILKADLLHNVWVEVTLSNPATHNYGIGNNIIKSVALEIDNSIVEEHTGGWLNTYGEMFHLDGKRKAFDKLVGNCVSGKCPKKLFVPLRFFFCNNPGCALPLVSMKSSQIRLIFHFADREQLGLPVDCEVGIKIWGDGIFLDKDEHARFATTPMEYLIEQVQIKEYTLTKGDNKLLLPFNNCVKALYWTMNMPDNQSVSYPLHDDNDISDTQPSSKIVLNGQDRFDPRNMEYFLRTQPYNTHVNSARENLVLPGQDAQFIMQNKDNTNSAVSHIQAYNQYIYMYSFALKPAEYQPSGTCNMTRIDTVYLNLNNMKDIDEANGVLTIYAHSYNMLNVEKGIGSILYPLECSSPRQKILYKL
jgi:hypothetical protein